jgi:hypothetical protein
MTTVSKKSSALRHLLLVTITFLFIFFTTSCGNNENKIIGKWGDDSSTIEFFKDKTFTMSSNSDSYSGKWFALDDNRIKMDVVFMGITSTMFVKFKGDGIVLILGEEEQLEILHKK